MSIVDTETGEVLSGQCVELTREQAERLTGRIAEKVIDAHSLILQAMQGRADKALGYDSWQAYVEDRFPLTVRQVARDVRPELVAQLRSEGHSFRAIATTLGVDAKTVRNDLATGECSPVDAERVVGIDGKSRPATRPVVIPEVVDDDEQPAMPSTTGVTIHIPAARKPDKRVDYYAQALSTLATSLLGWKLDGASEGGIHWLLDCLVTLRGQLDAIEAAATAALKREDQ